MKSSLLSIAARLGPALDLFLRRPVTPCPSKWYLRLSLGWILVLGAVLAGRTYAEPPAGVVAPVRETEPAPKEVVARFVPSVYKTFAEWKAACEPLPSNRSLKYNLPPVKILPLKQFADFAEVLQAFLELSRTNDLADDSAWLGGPPLKPQFFDTESVYFLKPSIPFQPFLQRKIVPPGTQVIFHGDFHGDIRSMVAWVEWMNRAGYLRDFKVIRPDVRIVLLGDYTDRGLYGVEVIYTILRLKVENPQQVLMVRGNHEDVSLASRYGFIAEGRGKYGRDFDSKRVMRLYDFLPIALYLGCETNVIQCNHGGMEPGFDPRPLLEAPDGVQFQLLGKLRQQQFLKENPRFVAGLPPAERRLIDSTLLDFQPDTPTSPSVIGFMWNDFSVVHGEPQFEFDPGRAFVYGENTSRYLMRRLSSPSRRIQAVFRAHQHASILNSMMRRLKAGHGVYRHWQENDSIGMLDADVPAIAKKIDISEERSIPSGSVWTFNVAPDSVYGEACDFSFDTWGILTVAKDFKDWKLRVANQTVRK